MGELDSRTRAPIDLKQPNFKDVISLLEIFFSSPEPAHGVLRCNVWPRQVFSSL